MPALPVVTCAGGCAGGASTEMVGAPRLSPAGFAAPLRLPPAASGKFEHVVPVVQEYRSFDDLFQGYPGAYTQSYGYDGARK